MKTSFFRKKTKNKKKRFKWPWRRSNPFWLLLIKKRKKTRENKKKPGFPGFLGWVNLQLFFFGCFFEFSEL